MQFFLLSVLVFVSAYASCPVHAVDLATTNVPYLYNFTAAPASDLQPLYAVRQYPACEKLHNCWMGGDCGSAVRLVEDPAVPGQRVMTIFGDTLLGNVTAAGERHWTDFVHNTATTATITYPDLLKPDDYHFYWRIDANTGRPTPLFEPPPSEKALGQYYWVTTATMLYEAGESFVDHAPLLLFAQRIQPNTTAGGFGFSVMGTAAIHVANPWDAPNKWDYTTMNVPFTGSKLDWFPAVFLGPATETPRRIYTLGMWDRDVWSREAVLARIPVYDAREDMWEKMEYWGTLKSGGVAQWLTSDQITAYSQLQVLDPLWGAPENSVEMHPYMQQWYTLVVAPFTTSIYLSSTKDLTGPWSKPVKVYDVPAPYNNTAEYFCYAPKAHPELAEEEDEIIFTYNCNSNNWIKHGVHDLNFYVPQVVRVKVHGPPHPQPSASPTPLTTKPSNLKPSKLLFIWKLEYTLALVIGVLAAGALALGVWYWIAIKRKGVHDGQSPLVGNEMNVPYAALEIGGAGTQGVLVSTEQPEQEYGGTGPD